MHPCLYTQQAYHCLVPSAFNSLKQCSQMQHIGNCYSSWPCQCLMCFGTLPTLPSNLLWHCKQSKKTWHILFPFTDVVGVQRPIWRLKRLVNPTLAQHIFSPLSKDWHLQLYQLHLVNLLYLINPFHLVNQLHLVNPLQPFNPLIVVLNIHGGQLEEHLVCLPLHSCMVYFLTLFLRPEAPNYTNW